MRRLNRINLNLEKWKLKRAEAWRAFRRAADEGRSCGWEWEEYRMAAAVCSRLQQKLDEASEPNRWHLAVKFFELHPWSFWVLIVVLTTLLFWSRK